MTEPLHLSIDSSLQGLGLAVEQMDTFAANHGLTAETTGQLQLAMEEMVTNVIKYGYAGEPGNRIDLEFALCSDEVVLRVKDSGPAFNPLLVAPPNLDLPPEQKKPGGLGELHRAERNGVGLSGEGCPAAAAQARMGDVMGGPGGRGHITAQKFVLALGPRFDTA